MRRVLAYTLAGLALVFVVVGLVWHARGPAADAGEGVAAGRAPRIRPDYADTVVPPNIAPLNFVVDEPGRRFRLVAGGDRGAEIAVESRGPGIVIPVDRWSALLAAHRGAAVRFGVSVLDDEGRWLRFEPFVVTVAAEPIDRCLVYRKFRTVYNYYRHMSICQRDLSTYDESLVVDNTAFGRGCVNCHAFHDNLPDRMAIQMRSNTSLYASGMVLVDAGHAAKVATGTPAPPAYMSWHPSGRAAVFSMNKVRQFFHSARPEVRGVVDLDSDLALYVVGSADAATPAAIRRPDRLETYPDWSPDGRTLYYCSAPMLWSDRDTVPPEHFDEVRYDLMRIPWEPESGAWGRAEIVLSAEDTGLSITLPRVSPDGRFVLFCMSDYGCFPIYQEQTDLYMLDLGPMVYRRLAVNSEAPDSWHSWSSEGRWFVFSSKRMDGLLARPFFAHVDDAGRVAKPFVMPQQDPAFYDTFLETYNVPELIREPIAVGADEIAAAMRSNPPGEEGLPTTRPTPVAAGAAGVP